MGTAKTRAKHRADIMSTRCGHDVNTMRTSCVHRVSCMWGQTICFLTKGSGSHRKIANKVTSPEMVEIMSLLLCHYYVMFES